jgi:hypothetical protein
MNFLKDEKNFPNKLQTNLSKISHDKTKPFTRPTKDYLNYEISAFFLSTWLILKLFV